MMCFISVLPHLLADAVAWIEVGVASGSLGMPSAHWNIFIALRELVDHKMMAPSHEPEANRFTADHLVQIKDMSSTEHTGHVIMYLATLLSPHQLQQAMG